MIVSLPNGKCIEVSLETYFRMTDDDFEYLIAINWGDRIENPFYSSVLSLGEHPTILSEEDIEELGIEDISELDLIDPTDPTDEDIDYTPED